MHTFRITYRAETGLQDDVVEAEAFEDVRDATGDPRWIDFVRRDQSTCVNVLGIDLGNLLAGRRRVMRVSSRDVVRIVPVAREASLAER